MNTRAQLMNEFKSPTHNTVPQAAKAHVSNGGSNVAF